MVVSDQPFIDLTVEEFYQGLDQRLRRIKYMNLARWKLLQNTIVSLLVAYLVVKGGADPTVAIGVIAAINGLSFAELATIFGNSPQLESRQQPNSDSGDSQK